MGLQICRVDVVVVVFSVEKMEKPFEPPEKNTPFAPGKLTKVPLKIVVWKMILSFEMAPL